METPLIEIKIRLYAFKITPKICSRCEILRFNWKLYQRKKMKTLLQSKKFNENATYQNVDISSACAIIKESVRNLFFVLSQRRMK